MTNSEIKEGIKTLCETSAQIKGFYDHPETLAEALNQVPKSELDQCWNYYADRSGVIIDLRKEVIQLLRDGKKVTSEMLENLINKHRNGKENQFRAYKQWFSIFYPPITFYGHTKIREFVQAFIQQLITDLKLEGKVASTYVDFQGARQQGSSSFWLALYNKDQDSHSSGLQFFVEFYDGKVSYGVYSHSNKQYFKGRISKGKEDFEYEELVNHFLDERQVLLDDSPQNIAAPVIDDIKSEISESLTENLNVILYGPPGTGKTYELSNYYFDKFTSKKSTVSKDEFLKAFIADRSWWEVIALVLLDIGKSKVADIFNHELLQKKASLSNSTTVTPTIWGILQSHTVDYCEYVKVTKKGNPLIFNKTEDKHWEILHEEVSQQAPELLELNDEIQNFSEESATAIKRYEFVTFHQSFTYEDFIEGIKPELDSETNDLTYSIQDGIFKRICKKAEQDPDQNYAIFIDEINRGNVSQIFGELITLIEEDKRAGEENELISSLPYSKKKFSVPSNLYIIGTMNTADRSIEALDTALRRRFSFVEMPAKPELIRIQGKVPDGVLNGIDLCELLQTINRRIEKLIDKDHMIGHSYFLNISNLKGLKSTFQNKIIPLLQEYFFGDYGKVGLVIGSGFFVNGEHQVDDSFFASFADYDSSSLLDRRVYHFRDVSKMKDEEFTAAISILLNR